MPLNQRDNTIKFLGYVKLIRIRLVAMPLNQRDNTIVLWQSTVKDSGKGRNALKSAGQYNDSWWVQCCSCELVGRNALKSAGQYNPCLACARPG